MKQPLLVTTGGVRVSDHPVVVYLIQTPLDGTVPLMLIVVRELEGDSITYLTSGVRTNVL